MVDSLKTSPPIPLSIKWRGVHPEGFTLKGNKRGRGQRVKLIYQQLSLRRSKKFN